MELQLTAIPGSGIRKTDDYTKAQLIGRETADEVTKRTPPVFEEAKIDFTPKSFLKQAFDKLSAK